MTTQEREWAAGLVRGAEHLLRDLGTVPHAERLVPTREQMARMIDHTLLKPEATPEMVDLLCSEARENGFAAVCVNPWYVARASAALRGTRVAVCSVVGFPLGASISKVKAFEAECAIGDGATEIDMVLAIGALKAQDYVAVRDDIVAVLARCRAGGALLKVIIEACLLTDLEKVIACRLIAEAGADYCKTSTGFSAGGATEHDVRLMRAAVGPDLGVKAAGGVRTWEQAVTMIRAGATRIGASAGPAILAGAPA